jgi:MFS family permease
MYFTNHVPSLARKNSGTRKGLRVLVFEGMMATVVLQLLAGPFQTGYLLHMGATSSEIGFVLAITTFVNVLQVFAAFWMQKSMTNRKLWLVIFGSGHRYLWVACGLIPFIIPQVWWVSAYIILYTTAFAFSSIASVIWTTLVGDMVPAAIRGRFFGLRNTLMGAWGIVVVFLGGQILKWYPGELGYIILFGICAVFAVLNMISFSLYPNIPSIKSLETNFVPMMKKPFVDRSFMKAIIFLSLWLFLQGITVPLFSYVMLNVLNISIDVVSIITVIQMIITMVAYYFWGNLNAKYSTRKVLYWTLPFIALSCLSWIGLLVLPVYAVIIMVHLFLGIGLGGYNQLVFNFIIGDTPKSERPMFVAIYSALTGFAAFLGPLVGGWLYGLFEQAPKWTQSFGISVSAGALLLILALTYGRVIFGSDDY